MTAVEAVATYLPAQRVPIDRLAERFDLTPMELRLLHRVHGLAEVRWETDGTLLDLLLGATAKLDALRGREHLVRYVLYARSMPVNVPYPGNPLHELCHRLGLDRAVAFTVTHQACATGLLAIDLAGRLLAATGEPDALALILAGEKAFTRDAQIVRGVTFFGEAAAACLVRSGGDRDRLLAYAVRTRGDLDGRMAAQPELATRFQRDYQEELALVLLAAVERAGLTLADINLLIPHNVNRVSWRGTCRRLGYPIAQVVLDNVPVTGHSFCADAFLNYQTAIEQGRLQPGDRYLVAAVGLGATFSAMVFEH